MAGPKVRFSVALPQHGATWDEVVRVAQACDRLGYHSVFAIDQSKRNLVTIDLDVGRVPNRIIVGDQVDIFEFEVFLEQFFAIKV